MIRAIVPILFCLPTLACSGEAEVFDKSSAAMNEVVGDPCSLGVSSVAGEITIEHPESCGDAVCLGLGDEPSECSCRCSGPEGGLPLCACPQNYHCQDELIAEIDAGSAYAGGYCVAD